MLYFVHYFAPGPHDEDIKDTEALESSEITPEHWEDNET